VATKGGFTVKRDGVILGGLGISGGSPDEDNQVCVDVLKAAARRPSIPGAGPRRQGLAGRRGRALRGTRRGWALAALTADRSGPAGRV